MNTHMEEYDICIIAVKEDAPVAHRLACSIRKYRLPGSAVLPDQTADYRRIYEDTGGEPFSEEKKKILDHSRFLIVMCSPLTKDNKDILDRLAWFRERNQGEHIIAVIVRGEPANAFPEWFIERKVVRTILPDMTVRERIETIEPIAADLNADHPRRFAQLLRYETVRITASVLGIHPDVLEQRHRARIRSRILAAAGTAAAACLISAVIFLRLGFIAREEGKIAAQQTVLNLQIAERTTEVLPARFADDPEALRYINIAVEKAKNMMEELEKEEEATGSREKVKP